MVLALRIGTSSCNHLMNQNERHDYRVDPSAKMYAFRL